MEYSSWLVANRPLVWLAVHRLLVVYCGADGDIGCIVAGSFLGCQLFSASLAEDFSKGVYRGS